jgi:hypothetical protein
VFFERSQFQAFPREWMKPGGRRRTGEALAALENVAGADTCDRRAGPLNSDNSAHRGSMDIPQLSFLEGFRSWSPRPRARRKPADGSTRTSSSSGLGIRMATSSPARCSQASRRQWRRSVLTLSPGAFGMSDGAITSQPRACCAAAGPARSPLGRPRSRLATGPDREPRHEPADRRLIMRDQIDVGDLLVSDQDPDRDRVLVDVQAEMDPGKVRNTSHGRLLSYVGSARPVWVTHFICGPEPAIPC